MVTHYDPTKPRKATRVQDACRNQNAVPFDPQQITPLPPSDPDTANYPPDKPTPAASSETRGSITSNNPSFNPSSSSSSHQQGASDQSPFFNERPTSTLSSAYRTGPKRQHSLTPPPPTKPFQFRLLGHPSGTTLSYTPQPDPQHLPLQITSTTSIHQQNRFTITTSPTSPTTLTASPRRNTHRPRRTTSHSHHHSKPLHHHLRR